VGERWTWVIVHELASSARRYSDLQRRLPGIGTSVLADRLRKLEQAGLVERSLGAVGEGVSYRLTESGEALRPIMRSLREWGVAHLVRPDGEGAQFDLRYVEGIESLPVEEFEWRIDGSVTALRLEEGVLSQRPGPAVGPSVVLRTSLEFMRRWAAGDMTWDEGRDAGDVKVRGSKAAFRRMQAATGYLTSV